MTQTNPPAPSQKTRRAFPVWLAIAVVMFVFMILVAGHVVGIITNWAVWLGAAGIALSFHFWFNWEI
jgi:hypothetical protein